MSFPLMITEAATRQLLFARESDEDLDNSYAVRVACLPGGCAGFRHNLDFDNEVVDTDVRSELEYDGKNISVVMDPTSAKFLDGVTLDYVTNDWNEGFSFQGGTYLEKSCACGSSAKYGCS